MPDEYYTLKEFNKRITEKLKRMEPRRPLVQRLEGLRLRFPKLPLLGRKSPRIK